MELINRQASFEKYCAHHSIPYKIAEVGEATEARVKQTQLPPDHLTAIILSNSEDNWYEASTKSFVFKFGTHLMYRLSDRELKSFHRVRDAAGDLIMKAKYGVKNRHNNQISFVSANDAFALSLVLLEYDLICDTDG